MEFYQATQPGHRPAKRRTLNVFVLSMFCVAVIVSLRNLPMSAHYGFSILFYYLVAALFFLIPYTLISAELASGWPKAGGVYVWVREALGERWGFFAIWMQWFHSMTWYPAMLAFMGSGIAYLFDPKLANDKTFLLIVILVGMWGITIVNFFGIKISAWLSTFCVIVGTILPGLLLIALAFFWMILGEPLAISLKFADFFPDLTHLDNLVFLAGIVLALMGMESTANFAREVRNPQKNYPKAIFMATIITLFILVLGSIAIALVIPSQNISLVSGLLDAFETFFAAFQMKWILPFMAIFTILGAIGELNAWTIAGVKGLFVTTEHGLLPPICHKTNEANTPTNLLLFQAIIVTICALVFLFMPDVNLSYWTLSALSVQMYLLMYILLFPAAIILRYRKPNVPRPYKVPGGNLGMWIISIAGFLAAAFALFISFFPPMQLAIKSIWSYELLIILSFAVIVALPFIVYALKKDHWKLDVLKDIREEIHRRTH